MPSIGMTPRSGYLKLATIGETTVRVHWTFPAGGLLIALLVGVEPVQAPWFCLAYTLLIVLHEAGHFAAARLLGLRVPAVEISGFGGLCRFEVPRRVRDSVFIVSAGLLAQAIAFVLAVAYDRISAGPGSAAGAAFVITFTLVNAIVFASNLLPQKTTSALGTDGYLLWRLFLHATRGDPNPFPPPTPRNLRQGPVFAPDATLARKPGFVPPGFVQGIEILNDDRTPMEFVVAVLERHLGLGRDAAVARMLDIHASGGMVIAVGTKEHARAIAAAISAEARAARHPLVCRFLEKGIAANDEV